VRVLAIAGSLRGDSYNTALLRAAAEMSPPGVKPVIYDRLRDIPPYDDDTLIQPGEAVEHLRAAVREADAILIATPEYNSSIPGVLKNALDWISRPLNESPLRNKPAAVIGASPGMFGAVWAQAETRKVLSAIGARVLDRELPVPAAHEKIEDGELIDQEIRDQIGELMTELADAVAERERLAA
jgi:chromate reductase